jgi:hypothetical protein
VIRPAGLNRLAIQKSQTEKVPLPRLELKLTEMDFSGVVGHRPDADS